MLSVIIFNFIMLDAGSLSAIKKSIVMLAFINIGIVILRHSTKLNNAQHKDVVSIEMRH